MRPRAGFQVDLAAAEPLVMDPIYVDWGPDGRLWVVEMADYPLGLDGKLKPGGRIRFLEDTDGDGRYDRGTVFLDALPFPSAVMPWRNGVLVMAEPLLFYAEDTDGDGRADVRRTLYEGFGGTVQQRRVNYPRLGLDNWIYLANGASRGEVRSVKTGEVVSFAGRDLRIRPDEGRIETAAGPTQWGRSRDDWGNWFGNNNSDPGFHFPLAEHYLRRNPHVTPPPMRVDLTTSRDVYPSGRVVTHCYVAQPTPPKGRPGRWTALCGATIYRDELFGPEYRGNYFVADSVYNVVHRMILTPDGVTFRGRRAPDETRSEFLGSVDPWFRPTSLRTGPDGALWVVDMCRIVIEHPEWIDDELEKTLDLRAGCDRGRIWRVCPEGKTPGRIPRLDRLDTAGLVAALDSPNGWQRDMAQLMLLWRGDESASGPLESMARDAARPQARLHAMATLAGLGLLREEIVLAALDDAHPGVRRHAVRLSEPFLNTGPAFGPKLLGLADDPDPQVRMQVACSLGPWRDARAGAALGRLAVRFAADPYMTAAVMSSAVGHLEPMAAEVLEPASEAAGRADLIAKLLVLAVATGEEKTVANVIRVITPRSNPGCEAWQFRVTATLLDALDRRKTPLAKYAAAAGPELKEALAHARPLFASARRLAVDESAKLGDRMAAVRVLGRGLAGQAEDLRMLCDLLTPRTPIELQLAVVESIGRLQGADVPELLLAGWSTQGPKVRRAVLDVLLSRAAWTEALVSAAETRPEVATAIDAARRERLLRHRSEPIRRRAEALFGRQTTSKQIQEVLKRFAPVLAMAGDPARGKEVFVEATCGDCHRLGEVGEPIGPDLRSLVDKSPEALLAGTLDPNRAVEGKYIEYVAVTSDGLTLSGMLFEETATSITLADTAGKLHTVLRKDLEELVSTGRSHMPEGLEGKLDLQSTADLFAFVAQSGPPSKEFAGNRPARVRPSNDGSLHLYARAAEIYGPGLGFDRQGGNLTDWNDAEDYAAWSIEVEAAGVYDVWLDWACPNDEARNRFRVEVGDQVLVGRVLGTGSWDDYRRARFGRITLARGQQRLEFRAGKNFSGALIHLRAVSLVPVEVDAASP